jgi:hypothetical protein
VTNGGIIAGSLAIYYEDPTGIAAELLPLAIANAQKNCAQAVLPDGSWSETPDYWYSIPCNFQLKAKTDLGILEHNHMHK